MCRSASKLKPLLAIRYRHPPILQVEIRFVALLGCGVIQPDPLIELLLEVLELLFVEGRDLHATLKGNYAERTLACGLDHLNRLDHRLDGRGALFMPLWGRL